MGRFVLLMPELPSCCWELLFCPGANSRSSGGEQGEPGTLGMLEPRPGGENEQELMTLRAGIWEFGAQHQHPGTGGETPK